MRYAYSAHLNAGRHGPAASEGAMGALVPLGARPWRAAGGPSLAGSTHPQATDTGWQSGIAHRGGGGTKEGSTWRTGGVPDTGARHAGAAQERGAWAWGDVDGGEMHWAVCGGEARGGAQTVRGTGNWPCRGGALGSWQELKGAKALCIMA